jgi:hypothetical protein
MIIRMGLVGVVLLAASPAMATTSISGDVAAGVRSTLGSVIDSHSNATNAVAPSAVTISTSATAFASDVGATNSTFANVTATWTSADSGNFGMDWGWNVNASGYGANTAAETNLAYPINWQYTFVASGNGVFSGRYDVVGLGDKFGLQPLYTTNDFSAGTLGGGVFDPTGSGTFSVILISGNTYTMSVAEFGNLSAANGFVANGNAHATVDWNISYAGTPEPSSWALLIAGFGLTGAAIRRRRAGPVRA